MTGGGRPGLLARVRAVATDPGSLRKWIVVANDGIIATAGILEGFSGAGATHATLVTAATSATIAGMLSAGGSEWSEAAAEREAQVNTAEEEAAAIARQPGVELAELAAYYETKGVALGAAIPLAITLTVAATIEARAIFVAALVSLTMTSIVSARTGRMNLWRTITRTLVVGLATMGVSYVVGNVVF